MGFIEREGKANTRSFRIDQSLDEELSKEAEKQGYSISNLIEKIIENYLNHYRWVEKAEALTVLRPILKIWLEYMDEETIKTIGEEVGLNVPKHYMLMRGVELDENSLKNIILGIIGGHDNWFQVSYHDFERPYYFVRNNLGSKWTTFIEAYLKALCKDALNKEIECERIGDNIQVFFK
jgi:hypothetical protein